MYPIYPNFPIKIKFGVKSVYVCVWGGGGGASTEPLPPHPHTPDPFSGSAPDIKRLFSFWCKYWRTLTY